MLFLAAGCSGFSGADRLFGSRPQAAAMPEEPAAIAAAPIPPPPADDFCARVAATARAKAVADGFDAATQERMRQQSFQQCAAMGQG